MADRPLQSLSIEGLNDTYVNTPLSTASTFDTSIAYAIGDYAFYNRKLYKFISEHAVGEWNSNDVVEITIGDELKNKINVPNTAAEKTAIKDMLDIVEEGVTATDANSDGNVVLDTTAGLSNEYVKKTDYATSSTAGVTMINNNFGVQIDNITPQYLRICPAAAADIKSASNSNFCTYRPITPLRQHQAVFYGLTKAAGVDMASSTNAVGTYTEEAKKAICNMIGVKYEAPFRLIKEVTITEETLKVFINTDTNDNPFSLTEMIIYLDGTIYTGNGGVAFIFNSSQDVTQLSERNIPYLYLGDAARTTATKSVVNASICGGRFFANGIPNATYNYNNTYRRSCPQSMGIVECNNFYEVNIYCWNDHKITSGTIKIYGR